MKNKKLNKVLLPAVLLIWLVVIFRWETTGERPLSATHMQERLVLAEDSSLAIPSLSLHMRDPFLGNVFSGEEKRASHSYGLNLIQRRISERPASANHFTYQGIIEAEGSKLGLLFLDAELKYVSVGENLLGWEVQSLAWDRLCLQKKKQNICLKTAQDTLM